MPMQAIEGIDMTLSTLSVSSRVRYCASKSSGFGESGRLVEAIQYA